MGIFSGNSGSIINSNFQDSNIHLNMNNEQSYFEVKNPPSPKKCFIKKSWLLMSGIMSFLACLITITTGAISLKHLITSPPAINDIVSAFLSMLIYFGLFIFILVIFVTICSYSLKRYLLLKKDKSVFSRSKDKVYYSEGSSNDIYSVKFSELCPICHSPMHLHNAKEFVCSSNPGQHRKPFDPTEIFTYK